MQFHKDTEFMRDAFEGIVSFSAPMGFFEKLNPVLAECAGLTLEI